MNDESSIGGERYLHVGSGPTTNIRLYLRASALPKIGLGYQQPDVLAKVSFDVPTTAASSSRDGDDSDSVDGSSGGSGTMGERTDETEVVRKCSNPRWTTTFTSRHEYGTQLICFVDIFAITTGMEGRGRKKIGRAAFDVEDVLGTANKIKARRLRKGGVVYAYIESEPDSERSSPPSSPGRRGLLSSSISSTKSSSPDGRVFNLRLRAESLVHTHSRLMTAVSAMSRPSTYYEISKKSSTSNQWIAVYRSPPVRESLTPSWDEASIGLGSMSDLGDFLVMVSVFKVTRTKCKEIGSFATTAQALIESCTTRGRTSGYSRRSLHGNVAGRGQEGQMTFRLLRRSAADVSVLTDEVTGIITVTHASVDNANDVRSRSKRFLSSSSSDNDDNDDAEGDSVSEAFNVDASRIVAPSLSPSSPRRARPRFVDYVRAGMVNVDFCVAVDFTSSNGDLRIPGTLHYSKDGMMNDYEESIAAFSSAVERFSPNKEYPVWGFGAKFEGEVRHIFQCGESRYANGTEGLLDAYQSIFETDLIMSGPTSISYVLGAAAFRARRFRDDPNTDLRYCILLILTDGCVHDLPYTQKLVRSYRDDNLPLSVIVVGIGRADFTEFHQWDQSTPELRGRFKFVEFREHQIDPDMLPRTALVNLPHEIAEYYMSRNITPPV